MAWLYAHSTCSPQGRMAVSPGDNTLALKAHVGCGRLPLSLASSDEAEGPPSERWVSPRPSEDCRPPGSSSLFFHTRVLSRKARINGLFLTNFLL